MDRQQRNDTICDLVQSADHLTLEQIGRQHGLTKERIRAIASVRGIRRNQMVRQRDLDILDAIRAGDQSYRDIGAQHGITAQRVSQIAQRHAVQSIYWPERVDPDSITRGTALFLRGAPIQHAADAAGLSRQVLANHLVRQGLHNPGPFEPAWSCSEDQVLRAKYGNYQYSARNIATELKRTRNEVIGRAHRLGLSKPMARDKHAA